MEIHPLQINGYFTAQRWILFPVFIVWTVSFSTCSAPDKQVISDNVLIEILEDFYSSEYNDDTLKLITLADSLNYYYQPHEILESLRKNLVAHYWYRYGNFNRSETYINESLEIARKYSKEFPKYLNNSLNFASKVAEKLLKFDDASSYIIENLYNLQLRKLTTDFDHAVHLYQLGNILYNREKYFECIDFLIESIKTLDVKKITDPQHAYNVLSVNFNINKLLADAYIQLSLYDSAYMALHRALVSLDSMYKIDSLNIPFLAPLKYDLGHSCAKVFLEKEQYNTADSILNHLLATIHTLISYNPQIHFRVTSLYCESLLKQNKISEAVKLIDTLEKNFQDILTLKTKYTAEYYRLKSTICARISDHQCAYTSKLISDAIIDSISKAITQNNTSNTTRHYMNLLNRITEEKYNAKIKKKNYTVVISAIVLSALLLFIYILYKQSEINSLHLKKEKNLANQLTIKNSELTLANKKLTELKLYNQFLLKYLAHDLRNPIKNIKGLVDLMRAEYNSENLNTYLELIDYQAKYSLDFINNVLKSSFTALEKKLCSVNEVIDSSIETNIQQAQNKNIRLIKDVTDTIYCNMDYYKIWSLLNNLIGNAIKFTHRNGVVTIRASKNPTHILISVQDQGIGIPESDIKKILSDESPGGRTGTDGEVSVGLGLKICKQIVREHSGQLKVVSEVGKGSTFTIILPCDENCEVRNRGGSKETSETS